MGVKRAKSVKTVTVGKRPRQSDEEMPKNFVWSIKSIDPDGDWGWRKLTHKEFWGKIFNRIDHYEKMDWPTILGDRSNHPIGIDKIVTQAQTRLKKIKLEDLDELYQLSVGNLERVWGRKIGNIFFVLWWDPEHTVYPIKRN